MERHSLWALVSIGLLVILAWLGIALFGKAYTGGASVVLIVLWAIAVLAVLGFAFWNLVQGRRNRIEHGSEQTRGK